MAWFIKNKKGVDMSKLKLIPGILEKTLYEVKRKIYLLLETRLDTAHLDVMDGLAVPNHSWGVAKKADDLGFKIEAHLMVQQPLKEAEKWLGLKNIERVIVRSEEIEDIKAYADLASGNSKLGIAIDRNTDLEEKLLKVEHHNHILVMGINSGFSRQIFDLRMLKRIRLIKKLWPLAQIGVDGGMNEKTIPLVKEAGANIINATSFFWAGGKYEMRRKIKLVEGK